MTDEDLAAQLQAAQDEIVGHLATIRRQSAKIGQLTREDPDKKLRDHAQWNRAHRLFRIWQRATNHPKARWSVPRFKECLPYLATYEDELVERAIEGLAYDPFISRSRNGVAERHDGWAVLFKPDNIERYANKAPLNWEATLEGHAAEVEGRR